VTVTFERRGSTWTASDDHWEVMLIARNVYHGTERLLATLTVAREIPYNPRQLILTERIDLMIATRRKHFASEAAERLREARGSGSSDGIQAGILSLVETFMEHLQLIHGEVETHDLGEIEVPKDLAPPYTLWPLVPSSRPGMLVAPSGSGKSTLAGAVGLSVVTGKSLLPRLEPRDQGPVLYIGQEETKEQWAARLRQLCKGHGIPIPKTGYQYMHLASSSLVESAEQVAEKAAGMKAALVIVDSAQATWGAESESVRGWATQWFNAVDMLETPTLVIDHPNRSETGKPSDNGFAAGSSVKRDRVGHSWSLKSAELLSALGEPKRYLVVLRDTKRNYVARQPDITYETLIKGYEWIRLETPSITAPVDFERATGSEPTRMFRRLVALASSMPEIEPVAAATALGLNSSKEIRAELRDDTWHYLPDVDERLDFRFVKVEGTGVARAPGRYVLESQPHLVQLELLEGGVSPQQSNEDDG
jgi:hypothetical protein